MTLKSQLKENKIILWAVFTAEQIGDSKGLYQMLRETTPPFFYQVDYMRQLVYLFWKKPRKI